MGDSKITNILYDGYSIYKTVKSSYLKKVINNIKYKQSNGPRHFHIF